MRTILVTPGDPSGIGPEITVKTLLKPKYARAREERFICVGAFEPFEKQMKSGALRITEEDLHPSRLKKLPRSKLLVIPAPSVTPQTRLHLEGYQSGWSIDRAARLVLEGQAHALVTGPISKERLQKGGFRYSGHTDFLADICQSGDVTMMLANESLRVSLVTVHMALADVPKALTRESLRRAVIQTAQSLERWWGIRKPKIACAALNPHAGEGGLFGKEEALLIGPALASIRSDFPHLSLFGPFPADTLFANNQAAPPRSRFDAVICMYHDQGLIPVKLLDFQKTVNITLGLPIIRTSVDHGVAFDIAGKNKADPSSLEAAIDLAIRFVRKSWDKSREPLVKNRGKIK